jgi:peptidoglycan/xylan/chitin deacetylase (PgdA/CDA1 family)
MSRQPYANPDDQEMKSAALTFPVGMVTFHFDDGRQSVFTNARGPLRDTGIHADLYIITGRLDQSGSMTTSEMLALRNDGNVIGGHTKTHPHLTCIAPAQQTEEIKGGRDILQGLTGDPVATFAYPFGDGAQDDKVIQVVRDAGYLAARTAMPGLNTPATDPYKLRRFPDDWRGFELPAVKAKIEDAITNKHWLIFEMHEVTDTPAQYNTTPELLRDMLDYAASRQSDGVLRVVTTSEGISMMNGR